MRHAKADGNATIDYGFHMIISDVRDDVLAEMDTLVDEGVTTFKLFTAYPGVFFSDDGAIFRAMQQTARNGGLIMMHAENGLAIDVIAGQTFDAGQTDPYYHGTSRSPVLEGEATNRVIRLAETAGAAVYIVHLSARHALDEVRRARAEGCPRTPRPARSTCSSPWRTWATGSRARSSSAPRRSDRRTTRRSCGRASSTTTSRSVSTDHCPFDFHGQKEMGRGDFRQGAQRPARRREPRRPHARRRRGRGAPHPEPVGGAHPPPPPACSACRRRARWRWARTRTSSSTTRTGATRSAPRPTTWTWTTPCYEGREVTGGSDVVLSRGKVIVDGDDWLGGRRRQVPQASPKRVSALTGTSPDRCASESCWAPRWRRCSSPPVSRPPRRRRRPRPPSEGRRIHRSAPVHGRNPELEATLPRRRAISPLPVVLDERARLPGAEVDPQFDAFIDRSGRTSRTCRSRCVRVEHGRDEHRERLRLPGRGSQPGGADRRIQGQRGGGRDPLVWNPRPVGGSRWRSPSRTTTSRPPLALYATGDVLVFPVSATDRRLRGDHLRPALSRGSGPLFLNSAASLADISARDENPIVARCPCLAAIAGHGPRGGGGTESEAPASAPASEALAPTPRPLPTRAPRGLLSSTRGSGVAGTIVWCRLALLSVPFGGHEPDPGYLLRRYHCVRPQAPETDRTRNHGGPV